MDELLKRLESLRSRSSYQDPYQDNIYSLFNDLHTEFIELLDIIRDEWQERA